MTTPTNDAPVTVEQIAARLIDQSDEPDWTGGNYSERMNYWRDKAIDCSNRLAALASAPAGEGVPVAWMYEKKSSASDLVRRIVNADRDNYAVGKGWTETPLYPALARPRAAVEPFLAAILAQSPNGEPVTVAYHPNGDWSVYDRPRAAVGEREV